MAIKQTHEGKPGSEQHLGVDVGAQAGTSRWWEELSETGEAARASRDSEGLASTGAVGSALGEIRTAIEQGGEKMKVLKPLPHAVIDYAWAGAMMAAPWLFGFSRNRKATTHAVASGAAILGLSLMTRYPLGAVKLVSFPTHGVIETIAGMATMSAPWLMGFAGNKNARLTHVISGLATLGVVAMTDYRAQEQLGNGPGGSAGGLLEDGNSNGREGRVDR